MITNMLYPDWADEDRHIAQVTPQVARMHCWPYRTGGHPHWFGGPMWHGGQTKVWEI